MRKFILEKRFSLPEAIVLIGIAVFCVSVVSYAVTVPNTFTSGTTAKSSEVNANFAALVSAVTDLETQVADQQAEIATLQTDLSTVQSNSALQLDSCLTMTEGTIEGLAGPHVIFEGVNVHIRSGNGATNAAVNGLGNLLVGYNEDPGDLDPGDRGGSHNLIVGSEHKYLSYGGLVAGYDNFVSGSFASVSGGRNNTASNYASSVSGGYWNTASGQYSSVSGGRDNTTSRWYSSISGGIYNTASGQYSSVSGGWSNTASGYASSISGGEDNTASGQFSSVSGGSNNSMINDYGWLACDTYSCTDAP